MSRTILDPEYANSLNGLFNGTTPIEVSTVEIGIPPNQVLLACQSNGVLTVGGDAKITGSDLTLGLPGSDVVLSCNANDSLVVGGFVTATSGLTAQNGTLTLGVSPAAVVLTGTTGYLEVAGSILAEASLTVGSSIIPGTVNFQLSSSDPSNFVNMNVSSTNPNYVNISSGITTGEIISDTYRGGIGYLNSYVTPTSTISPGGFYTNAAVIIPNFIGSATSAYVISINTSTDPAIPYNQFVPSVAFVAAQVPTNSTIVSVQILNASTLPVNSYDVYFSIIAMN